MKKEKKSPTKGTARKKPEAEEDPLLGALYRRVAKGKSQEEQLRRLSKIEGAFMGALGWPTDSSSKQLIKKLVAFSKNSEEAQDRIKQNSKKVIEILSDPTAGEINEGQERLLLQELFSFWFDLNRRYVESLSSGAYTKEPRAYSAHELRKASELTEPALKNLNKQLNLWQTLTEENREEFRAYIGSAAAGQLKTLGEQLTVDQLTALGGLWNAATAREYQSDNLHSLPADLQQQVQPYTATGGLIIRFDSWAELYRAMGYNPTEGPKTQQRAHKAFISLQDLKVPLIYRNMNPNQKRGDRKAIIEPAGSVIKTFYLPYESETGKPSTDIVVWIREDFVRDAIKFYVQYPANLIEQIQEAARAAGYPRTSAFDILFVKWIYFADPKRKNHKGSASLEGLADRLRLGQYLRSKRWGEIEEKFARGLKIAIQGGWLLPESKIEDRKLHWKRNPEKFPGGKKDSPILSP